MREMKDSGIEWVGAIPQDWQLSKIGSLYTQRNEKVSDKDYQPLSVTMQGILPQLATAAKTDDGDNRKLVRVGDFAINSRSDRRGSCGISPLDGSVSLINIILTPRTAMHPGYYNWLFHTTLFADEFYKWGHGIVADLWTTRWQEMKSITVPVPEYVEQERIAAFLDAECAEIDTVLEKTRASIEEYKKLKQAVITQAVTKGIRGDRPMKDSGIEWIGDIPAEWDYTKAKNCVDIQNGSDPKTEGSIPVYGSGASSFKTCGEYKEGPSVLIGRKGATLHIPHYISTKFWNVDTAFNVYAKPNFDLKFYFYCACSFDYRFYISQTTLPSMTQTAYENMFLPLPSNDEQRAIASYLDNRCEEIDALIWKKQECLAEIENYKKSLIYEYVTGKKEVKTSVLAD
jgi:hypothetical protein